MRLRLATLTLGALTLGVLGTLAPGYADPPPARARLTLADCIARAERTYPGLAAQRHKIAASEAQLSEAWSAPFLNLNITGAFAISPYARGNATFSPDAFAQNPFETGYEPLGRLTIETGIPVSPWTWWRIGQARDAARAGIRANEYELVKARLELRTNVRRAFFGLQLARDSKYLVDRALGYLDTAERQLESMRDSDAGSYNPNDGRQLRMSRHEARARLSEANRGEALAAQTLGALTGVGDRIDIVDEPLCPYQSTVRPLTDYVTEARLQRPEIGMIDAGVAARRAAVAIQWGAYLPDVALGLQASMSSAPSISDQSNPFAGGNANFAYWGGALVLRWTLEPLTNWFRIRRVREELAMTLAQQRLAVGAIGIEVAEVHGRAVDAQGREREWSEAEREGYEWFTSVFQEYQSGTGEASAIIAPLRAYLQARASHLQATFDFNVALAQLAQVTGREDVPGAPAEECARPSAVRNDGADEDGGVSQEEIDRILNDSLGEPDAAVTDVRPVNAPPPARRTTR